MIAPGVVKIEPNIQWLGVTVDSIRWTADSDIVTVDTGSEVFVLQGNVRLTAVEFDKRVFRAPFGEEPHTDGTGKRGPEDVELTFEVTDPAGISAASEHVENLLLLLQDATIIHCHIGTFTPDGLLNYSRGPITAGYRLVIRMGTKDGLHPSDTSALRLIQGGVWRLR